MQSSGALLLVTLLMHVPSVSAESPSSETDRPPNAVVSLDCASAPPCRIVQSPRDELTGVDLVFLAVALESPPSEVKASTAFRVEEVWRGNLRTEIKVNVWLHVSGCLQEKVERGSRYLVYARGPQMYPTADEPISPRIATAIPENKALELIEFLSAPAHPAVSREELVTILERWRVGEIGTNEAIDWFHVAYVEREIAEPLSWSVVERMYFVLRPFVRLKASQCVVQEAVASRVLEFMEQNPDPTIADRDAWLNLTNEFGMKEQYNRCVNVDPSSIVEPPN